MDLVLVLDKRLQAELLLEAYAEAQARGRATDVQATARALLDDSKMMAS
jgi:hypothetical protein